MQPAHEVLRRIYAAEQREEECVEPFICSIRALMAKLPYVLDNALQVDVCYGLLHRRVTKRVCREGIRNVDELIEKCRIVGDTYKALKCKVDSVSKNIVNSKSATITDRNLTRSSSPTTECEIYGFTQRGGEVEI
ncbi:hypothetical protein ACJJTC_005940 [Scirpophaga incertulas]